MIIATLGALFQGVGWGLVVFLVIAALVTVFAIVNLVRRHGGVKPREVAPVRHGRARK
jgi:hypothetical protein